MTVTKPAHGVVITLAAWGHVRPMVHLALNLLVVHPALRLTILVTPSTKPRVASELAQPILAHLHRPGATGDVVADRLQVVEVTSPDWSTPAVWSPEIMGIEAMDYVKALPAYLTKLYGGSSVFANLFEGVPPGFIVFDLFQTFVPETVRQSAAANGVATPNMIGFTPSNAAAAHGHVALAENGGFVGETIKRVAADVATGRDAMEAYGEHMFEGQGKVRHVPGLPPKFDFEWHPLIGCIPLPPAACQQVCGMYEAIRDKDTVALVIPFTRELERDAPEAVEREIGKELIMAGVQFPEPVWEGVKPDASGNSDEDKRVIAFLDDMQQKHGSDSVLYMSFGSMFYPLLRPELVAWLVDSLLEAGMPFLFAHATQMTAADPAVLAKIDAHPDACQVKFAPQWQVLEHDAVGFFFSHCGSNSSAEAIMSRVPLVALPFAADQGEYASLWTDVYGCCITLKQGFTPKAVAGAKLRTLYDGTEIVGTEKAVKAEARAAWDALRGPKGKEMRASIVAVRDVVEKSYRAGESREAMLGFERFF